MIKIKKYNDFYAVEYDSPSCGFIIICVETVKTAAKYEKICKTIKNVIEKRTGEKREKRINQIKNVWHKNNYLTDYINFIEKAI